MSAWDYILLCVDGSYYTGCTTALATRIAQHESGVYEGYTSSRLPVRLIWLEEFMVQRRQKRKNIRACQGEASHPERNPDCSSSRDEVEGWQGPYIGKQ